MANESKHPADLPKDQLQLNLQKSETIRQAVKSIRAKHNQYTPFTGAEHDFAKPVAIGSLRVELDPAGNLNPAAGQTLVCRGTAWIKAVEQQVVLFRV